MATKEEIAERLNEYLDEDLGWEKMDKTDLIELEEKVHDGTILERLLRKSVAEKGREQIEGIVNGWEPGAVIRRAL